MEYNNLLQILFFLIPFFPIQHLSLNSSTISVSLFLMLIIIVYIFMNKQSVLIFKLPELFNILNELKDHLDFNIYNFLKKKNF